jgi:hypothetical protein
MPERATRDWYTRVLVRIKKVTTKRSVDPYTEYTFLIDEKMELLQWGRAGRPVRRDSWWTSFDIDGAYIFSPDEVEIVKVLDEQLPE